MNLDRQIYDDAVLISVHEPRIDAAIAIQFKDKVRELATDAPDRVVMDMSKVDFLDSSGLGALVATMKQLGTGRKLELASLSPTVQKVFRLTRMDSVFVVHSNKGAAISELGDGD